MRNETLAAPADFRAFDETGYAILHNVVPAEEIGPLVEAIEAHVAGAGAHEQAGLRTVGAHVPEVLAMRQHPSLVDLAGGILGAPAFVVRTLLFDKTPGANWKVPGHQDLTIAVRERREVAGFGPWSVKDGIPHVQPPIELLARMVTLRLHLDDCHDENGPLRVLPGTHRAGRLSPAEIVAMRNAVSEVTCEVPRGGVLVMRPLLLHASSQATSPRHRRVLHLEFASAPLPGGLVWAEGGPPN